MVAGGRNPKDLRLPVALTEDWGRKNLEYYSGMTRAQSRMLFSCRTERIGLRKYLHDCRIPGFESPTCPCGRSRETVFHLLVECPRLREARMGLFQRLGHNDFTTLLTKDAKPSPNGPYLTSISQCLTPSEKGPPDSPCFRISFRPARRAFSTLSALRLQQDAEHAPHALHAPRALHVLPPTIHAVALHRAPRRRRLRHLPKRPRRPLRRRGETRRAHAAPRSPTAQRRRRGMVLSPSRSMRGTPSCLKLSCIEPYELDQPVFSQLRSFQSVRHAPLLDPLSHISFLTPLASPDVTHLSKGIGKPQPAQPRTSCRSFTDTIIRHFNTQSVASFRTDTGTATRQFNLPPQHAHDPPWSHSTTLIIDFPMTVRRLSLVCRIEPQSHELRHPVDIVLQRHYVSIFLVLLLRQPFQRVSLMASKVHDAASVGCSLEPPGSSSRRRQQFGLLVEHPSLPPDASRG
ncbi:hypothetical protein FPHYL_7423 [Fusarium phyllophilum]|uniref:Reverse transcriptase n=1 Tax=Fusarium phyllophilum TaxID=47803 RepID=A0A8H5JQL1_9HYPO|nr:hypothetical protein FPHYL_7423 [Fusarium phyllophilum]